VPEMSNGAEEDVVYTINTPYIVSEPGVFE